MHIGHQHAIHSWLTDVRMSTSCECGDSAVDRPQPVQSEKPNVETLTGCSNCTTLSGRQKFVIFTKSSLSDALNHEIQKLNTWKCEVIICRSVSHTSECYTYAWSLMKPRLFAPVGIGLRGITISHFPYWNPLEYISILLRWRFIRATRVDKCSCRATCQVVCLNSRSPRPTGAGN